MIFFTSDLHFDHRNIIEYCDRPYRDSLGKPDAGLMNHYLIANFNQKVAPDDTVYILGDICFGSDPGKHLSKMNGKKHLIIGNHDKYNLKKMEPHFVWMQHYFELITTHPETKHKLEITMLHFPIDSWNKKGHGTYHLHGHMHSKTQTRTDRRLDVGVDGHNYQPLSLKEVCTILDKRVVSNSREDY